MKAGHPIRVLIVDDLTNAREELRDLLGGYPNIEVVGEAGDGEDAYSKARTLEPAVVVMDVSMPKMDGITATQLIKQDYPQIAVVGLTADPPEYVQYAMLKAGAFEVVMKEKAASELYSAIQRAVASVQPILVLEEVQLEPNDSIAPMSGGESDPSAVVDVIAVPNPADTKPES